MRLAVVSDIHGNLTALDAMIADLDRRAPDAVLHGGDLALAGAQPAEVVDRVRELGWPGVVGNTDELLWRPEELAAQERAAPKLLPLLRLLFEEYAPATLDALGAERLAWLQALRREYRDGELLLLHASPDSLWKAPMPDAEDSELIATYDKCGAALVVYGHIHRPFVRRLGAMTVANSGSAGSPLDGDPRASYLLIEDGRPQIVRVEYDIEREVRLLLDSGYPDAARIAAMRRSAAFLPPRAT
jgi:putative phosphoesterase